MTTFFEFFQKLNNRHLYSKNSATEFHLMPSNQMGIHYKCKQVSEREWIVVAKEYDFLCNEYETTTVWKMVDGQWQ